MKAIELSGGAKNLADEMGITDRQVYYYLQHEAAPKLACLAIHFISTGGKLTDFSSQIRS